VATLELIDVLTPVAGPVPPTPLTPQSLLLEPDCPARGGVLLVPDWAGYAYDRPLREIATALADAGYRVLSLMPRRRGLEGALLSLPDDDLDDLRCGVDALTVRGCTTVLLAGAGVGAVSAARYATRGDARVAGVALVGAPPDLPDWFGALPDAPEHYRTALLALRQGKAMAVAVDAHLPTAGDAGPLWLHQLPGPFLAWWGATAPTRLSLVRPLVAVPLRDVAPDRALTELPAIAAELLPPPAAAAATELLTARTVDGTELAGYLRTPTGGADMAVLTVHGMAQGPFSTMARRFSDAWLSAGLASLAIETRRSGLAGVMASRPQTDVDDIAAFVDLLAARGHRVVLAGASLGSQAVTRYLREQQPEAVVAAVHLAPTDDCPDWARRALGDAEYDRLVREAQEAVDEGRPDDLVVADWTLPPPARFRPTMRLRQTATTFLSWWGPDADTRHLDLIADVEVPLLLLYGSEDDHNTPERIAALQAAAVRARVVEQRCYDDCDHDFGRFEQHAVDDVVAWLAKVTG
jgi:alpha-beta hydrolase superfamily lysophospholipase